MFFEIALIGTTASGKTDIANTLAKEFKASILSLDSLCVYKEINIACAKSDEKDLKELDYFGVNLLSVDAHFDVSLFIKEYQKAKEFAQKQNKALIITGGTSFYLKAMMEGLSAKIVNKQTNLNNEQIYTLLKKTDPDFKVERNDTYRLQKWLNIYESTKEIPSIFLKKTKQEAVIKELEIYELVLNKEELNQKIAIRTKTMFQKGLLDEAKFLFQNFDENLKPLNSIGLKECKAYLKKQISLQECEALINIHTAQLAKRQRTFNKKFQSKILQNNEAFEILKMRFKH